MSRRHGQSRKLLAFLLTIIFFLATLFMAITVISYRVQIKSIEKQQEEGKSLEEIEVKDNFFLKYSNETLDKIFELNEGKVGESFADIYVNLVLDEKLPYLDPYNFQMALFAIIGAVVGIIGLICAIAASTSSANGIKIIGRIAALVIAVLIITMAALVIIRYLTIKKAATATSEIVRMIPRIGTIK